MQQLVIIISGVNKALAFEWMAEQLDRKKFNVRFILLNDQESTLEKFFISQGFEVTRWPYSKKPDLARIIFRLFSFFKKHKPDIVHCHLFEASIAGLTAAWLAGVKKRIYTRHYSTLQHTYFKKGVKYDEWCNRRATHIVAVSEVVKRTLIEMEGVSREKITIIHHGLKKNLFQNINDARIEQIRNKYSIPSSLPVIGAISRYLHLKGVTYIIDSFAELLKSYPQAFLILANASGDYKPEVTKALKKIPAASYREIEFEEDLPALYRLFDVFVHIPVDNHSEAFGQTYVEALAAGVPSVFTISGVAEEFIQNNENALVVDYKNSTQITEAIKKILGDEELRNRLIANGKASAAQFDIEQEMKKLELLYLD
jgi:glycosyltransferase involved in cell wall biosynthesis